MDDKGGYIYLISKQGYIKMDGKFYQIYHIGHTNEDPRKHLKSFDRLQALDEIICLKYIRILSKQYLKFMIETFSMYPNILNETIFDDGNFFTKYNEDELEELFLFSKEKADESIKKLLFGEEEEVEGEGETFEYYNDD